METAETSESFSLKNAEKSFQIASERLFGINDRLEPNINLVDEEQVKAAVQEVLAARLDLLKEKQNETRASMESRKGKGGSIFDYDKEITTLERAIGVVEGRRSNPDSLVASVSQLANEAAQRSADEHTTRLQGVPKVGIFGWGGKDQVLVRQEARRFDKETEQISSVLNQIKREATDWAQPPQTS